MKESDHGLSTRDPRGYKVRIVLSILAGELTCAEAARRAKVSETTVGNWKRQFLEGGAAGVEAGGNGARTPPSVSCWPRLRT